MSSFFSSHPDITKHFIKHILNNICNACVSQERLYKPITVDHLAVHFVLDGSLLHQDSDEARRLRAKEGLLKGSFYFSLL